MRTSLQISFLLIASMTLQSFTSCFSRRDVKQDISEVVGERRIESIVEFSESSQSYPKPPTTAVFSSPVPQNQNITSRTSFQKTLNPTGEPIGGGPGYSKYYSKNDARFVVSDKADLLRAINQADSLDVIFIEGDAIIDLTGEQIVVGGGVTIASDRGKNGSLGALLYSNTMYGQKEVDSWHDHLFITGGKNVHFSGLRLKGPSGEIFEHATQVACGIKGMHGYLEVSNCELNNWLKWAVDLAYARGDYIHHNHIHHTRRLGYGYGVWVRGVRKHTPPQGDDISLIEANLLEACRHEIGAGGMRTSSYIARYNIVGLHSMYGHSIDRHRQGFYTEVTYNLLTTRNFYVFSGMEIPPLDKLIFENNWCDLDDMDEIFPRRNRPAPKGTVLFANNELGGTWRVNQPLVTIAASTIQGTAPLRVSFQANGTDPQAYPIAAFMWDWKDGKDFITVPYSKMELTFSEPGIYHVRVRARNAFGLLSEPKGIKIQVLGSSQPKGKLYDNLIAFWEFDDQKDPLKDATGRYPLEMSNGTTKVTNGIIGRGMSRTGAYNEATDQLAVMHKNSSPFQPGENDYSFLLCFRADQHPDRGAYTGLFGFGASSVFKPGYIVMMKKSEPMELFFLQSDGFSDHFRTPIGRFQKGRWVVMVLSCDRDGITTAWLNGEKTASFNSPHPNSHIYHEHADFTIFPRYSTYPKASVDFAAVWNRSLSEEECKWLSNDGKGRTYSELKNFNN